VSLAGVLGCSVAAVSVGLALAQPAAATATDPVAVIVKQSRITTRLGENVSFRATFANRESTDTGPLIAHLNVLSLREGVEVDPEDWSTHRTRYLGAISSGSSRTITWKVHAINTGRIALYVAVLPQAGVNRPPAIGRTVQLLVAGRDTLNSGGILPLALGVPLLLGLMTTGLQLARRRR
jgi:hypothetical protein